MHGLIAWSTREAHLPLLRLAIEQGEKSYVQDIWDKPYVEDGLPPLHVAARLGVIDVFIALSARCQKSLRDVSGRTALWYACEKGHLPIVQLLFEHQTKVSDGVTGTKTKSAKFTGKALRRLDALDPKGYSPLLVATSNGHLETVRYLEGILGRTLTRT